MGWTTKNFSQVADSPAQFITRHLPNVSPVLQRWQNQFSDQPPQTLLIAITAELKTSTLNMCYIKFFDIACSVLHNQHPLLHYNGLLVITINEKLQYKTGVTAILTWHADMYVVGSKSFRPDQLFKVTEIKQLSYFFNIVSLYFNTLLNWYINLTIDGTIYPSQHFPFGASFVYQAGKFGTYYVYINYVMLCLFVIEYTKF